VFVLIWTSDTMLPTSNIRESSLQYSQKPFLTLSRNTKNGFIKKKHYRVQTHVTYTIGWIPRILQKNTGGIICSLNVCLPICSLVSKWLAQLAVLDRCVWKLFGTSHEPESVSGHVHKNKWTIFSAVHERVSIWYRHLSGSVLARKYENVT
jgi:hypothetical protein